MTPRRYVRLCREDPLEVVIFNLQICIFNVSVALIFVIIAIIR